MKHWQFAAAIAISSATVQWGCEYDCGDEECTFNKSEWALVEEHSPLPAPPLDPTNKYQNAEPAIRLGQKLFFDARYSGEIKILATDKNGSLATNAMDARGKVSCASCHLPDQWFIDTRTTPNNVSLGINYTGRNAPTLVNVAYYETFGQGGGLDTLWTQASGLPENAGVLGGDRCNYARLIFTEYRADYDAVFDVDLPADLETRFPATCKPKANAMAADGAWEMMSGDDKKAILQIMANTSKAIAAYETQLVSTNAPFDRYVAGDMDAIPPAAKRGLKLFIGKAACNECHSGAFFSDQKFHNLGVPQEGVNVNAAPDQGRFADLPRLKNNPLNSLSEFVDAPPAKAPAFEVTDADLGKFRTATLRGVARTAPYFHIGGSATLEDAVAYYNNGGGASRFAGTKDPRMVTLELTPDEIQDLVAFLESLTGEVVREDLRVNPFN
jgi:cytochrome c peroxidase